MNKGLELIEAAYLFEMPPADIVPVVHPQSVIHSMVEFVDGATIAQASPPDMRLPIALGLTWPERLVVPDVGPYSPGYAFALGLDRDGRVVTMQSLGRKDMLLDQVVDRHEGRRSKSDLIGQRRG